MVAPRRYGKSSLMYGMVDEPRPGWSVVYLNVEYVETAAELLNEVVARVLAAGVGRRVVERLRTAPASLRRWLSNLAEEVGVGIPDVADIKFKLRDRAPEDWRAAAEPFWRLLGDADPRVLVILDEFPVMVASMLERDEREALAFLHWFRALRQTGGRVLLGGSVNLEPLLIERGQSALLNDLERVSVPPFAPAEVRSFLAAVLEAEGVADGPQLAEGLAGMTDTGVPFFLQVFVDELLAESSRRGIPPNLALAREVLDTVVLGPRSLGRFSHYLERLRSYGRAEAAARETLHVAARGPVSLREVEGIARRAEVDSARLVARLEADWYLERQGDQLRFADPFVQRWWQQNAPMGPRR